MAERLQGEDGQGGNREPAGPRRIEMAERWMVVLKRWMDFGAVVELLPSFAQGCRILICKLEVSISFTFWFF